MPSFLLTGSINDWARALPNYLDPCSIGFPLKWHFTTPSICTTIRFSRLPKSHVKGDLLAGNYDLIVARF